MIYAYLFLQPRVVRSGRHITCLNKPEKYCFRNLFVIMRPALVNVALCKHMVTPAMAATNMNNPANKSHCATINAPSGTANI